MSEKLPPIAEQPIDYRAESIERAQGQEWDEMVAERGFELIQEQEQAAYDSTRPYKNNHGSARDPKTNKFITPDNYFEAKRRDHEELTASTSEASQAYDQMGILELARELAKAELSAQKAQETYLGDLLLDRMASQSEKYSATTEDFKGDNPLQQRQNMLWDRIMNYKDSYKETILSDKPKATEAPNDHQQEKWDETRSKIDYSSVRNTVKLLDEAGAPTSDIMRDMPAEMFIGGKSDEEIMELVPDVYWKWKESEQTRSRIDSDVAAKWMTALNEAGVPHEIIQDFPAEFFYQDDDPDQVDETPESFRKWQEQHPDIKIAENVALLSAVSEPTTKVEPALDEEVPSYNLRTRAKARMTGAMFAIQEKLGTRRGKAGLALGALALGAGLIIAKKTGVDFNPFNGDHHSTLDAATPKGGGSGAHHDALNGHKSGASHELAHRHVSGMSAHEAANHHIESLNGQNDTIWDHAEKALKKEGIENPSNKQIVKKTQSILMSNGLTWKGARSLPIGYKFKV